MIGAITTTVPTQETTAAFVPVDPTSPAGVQPVGKTGWDLVMSEEFNHPMNVLDPNTGFVAFHPGGGAWRAGYPLGHAEELAQTGTRGTPGHQLINRYTLGSLSTLGGSLHMTARRRPLPAFANDDYPLQYDSGMLTSWEFWNRPFGYYEARMKLPGDKVSWPAFWLYKGQADPYYHEIDVMECFFSATQIVVSNHAPGRTVATEPASVGVRNWNVYGVEWGADVLRWYVNGVLVATETNPAAIPPYAEYIILNHALQQKELSAPELADQTTKPERSVVEVDYVRVWDPA